LRTVGVAQISRGGSPPPDKTAISRGPCTVFTWAVSVEAGTLDGRQYALRLTVPADAGNPNTSYTRANFVLVTLTLNDPLPPNLPLQPIMGRAGFSLVMNDGQQTLSFADLQSSGSFAFSGHVATDATGRISAWSLGLFPLDGSNRWIVTASPDVAIYGDQGVMGGVDFGVTCTSLDTASCIPGTWSSLPSGPGESIRNLISLLSTVSGLNPGQVSSLTDRLRDALASVDAGLIKQAINQLNAFINEVRAAQKKIGVVMATTLTAAATAIIAML
jgi:hypothetical protein